MQVDPRFTLGFPLLGSALKANMIKTVFKMCFQFQLAPL